MRRSKPITRCKPIRRSLGAIALAALATAPSAAAATRPAPRNGATGTTAANARPAAATLLRSRQLWATIDVCNPFDKPDMIGIRGSMPGDGQPHDTMYMRFRFEYLDPVARRWTILSTPDEHTYVSVGTARSARQSGQSIQLVPVPGKPAYTLRGVVSFQWRHGRTVVQSATRVTSAGRQSLADADPPGYSAATCMIG